MVEDLVFHMDTGTFTCRTSIEANADRPLDDVLTYYREMRTPACNEYPAWSAQSIAPYRDTSQVPKAWWAHVRRANRANGAYISTI